MKKLWFKMPDTIRTGFIFAGFILGVMASMALLGLFMYIIYLIGEVYPEQTETVAWWGIGITIGLRVLNRPTKWLWNVSKEFKKIFNL